MFLNCKEHSRKALKNGLLRILIRLKEAFSEVALWLAIKYEA